MTNQPLSYESPAQASITRHEIGSLAIKLLGLYCIVLGLPNIGLALTYMIDSRSLRWGWGSGITIGVLLISMYGAMAAGLLLTADWLSGKLFARPHPGEASKAGAFDIQAIAFSIVGVLLVIWAVPPMVFGIAYGATRTGVDMPRLLENLTRCALGILLFVGGSALARLWHRIRTPRYPEP